VLCHGIRRRVGILETTIRVAKERPARMAIVASFPLILLIRFQTLASRAAVVSIL
jgi:hypothetical protein